MKKVFICFPDGKPKALTFSYDDGKIEDKRLIDIFDANGLKGTFNLNYGLMGDNIYNLDHPRVAPEEVKEVYKNHEVATHAMTHPTIERCPLSEVAWEILEDRKGLESLVEKPVLGHAYPNGSYSEEIKALLKSLGIAYARVVESRPDYKLPTDPYEWHPTTHHRNPELMNMGEFMRNFKKKQYLKLMYVWGHSYEFDDANNWDVIEKFAESMKGCEDIWYATNLEIIQYMDAAKRLVFGADNNFVYNPSAICVYLDIEGRYVEVGPGELKQL